MKKYTGLFLILVITSCFVACGTKGTEPEKSTDVDFLNQEGMDENDENFISEEEYEAGNYGVAEGPWSASSQQEIYELYGINLATMEPDEEIEETTEETEEIPEDDGIEDEMFSVDHETVSYAVNISESVANLIFEYGDIVLDIKAKNTELFEDVSYLGTEGWEEVATTVGPNEAVIRSQKMSNYTIIVCQWYDSETASSYSLSTYSTDPSMVDIVAISNAFYENCKIKN